MASHMTSSPPSLSSASALYESSSQQQQRNERTAMVRKRSTSSMSFHEEHSKATKNKSPSSSSFSPDQMSSSAIVALHRSNVPPALPTPKHKITTSRASSPGDLQRQVLGQLGSSLAAALVGQVDDPAARGMEVFRGIAVPAISVLDYVARLCKYVDRWAEEEAGPHSAGVRSILMALVLIQRSKLQVTILTVHRLLMTSVLIAVKFAEDFAISNTFWGDVGGTTLQDVNKMELEFCQIVDWKFQVSCDAYAEQQKKYVFCASGLSTGETFHLSGR